MTLSHIFETFKNQNTIAEKIEYLKELKSQKLPYDINFDNLIRIWETKTKH